MEDDKSCKMPTLDSKKEFRVKVWLYRDTIHSFGGPNETAVANVTIFMDVSPVDRIGVAKDHTGMLIGGDGGTGVISSGGFAFGSAGNDVPVVSSGG